MKKRKKLQRHWNNVSAIPTNCYNINQKCFISTFTSTFWCQLVLIIVINYLRGLELPHLAGAFFLASIQGNIVELLE